MNGMKRIFAYLMAFGLSCIPWSIQPHGAWAQVPPPGLRLGQASPILNGITQVDPSHFPTRQITFKETSADPATVKYGPSDYGAQPDAPTITFRAFFEGQRYSTDWQQDCGGANDLGCIVGNPVAPLAIPLANTYARSAATKADSNGSDGFVLGTQEDAAYSAVFDRDVASLAIQVLGLDEVGHTVVKLYDRQGQPLAQVPNTQQGSEFFGFATEDNQNHIAGFQVSMIAPEPNGLRSGIWPSCKPRT
jgi:hypothetical protein